MSKKIRLACSECDRDDFDGIDELPPDWLDVTKVQSSQDAHTEVAAGDRGRSIFEWQTHVGLCPDCQQAELG